MNAETQKALQRVLNEMVHDAAVNRQRIAADYDMMKIIRILQILTKEV